MRVVLDANVFVSGLISAQGPPGKVLDAWLNQCFVLFVSPYILDEINRVLRYPRVRKHLRPGQADVLMELLKKSCEHTKGELTLNVLTQDPSDNYYLACAVEAGADFLVTGNLRHYREAGNPFRGVQLLTPGQFLAILQGDTPP